LIFRTYELANRGATLLQQLALHWKFPKAPPANIDALVGVVQFQFIQRILGIAAG
jgi:hypothetical protein